MAFRQLGRHDPCRVTDRKDVDPIVRTSRTSLTDLLYRVEQRRRALLTEALLPRDLNLTQWIALCTLAKTASCTMTELALACAVDRTSLTRTIDNLVLRGLVIRSTPLRDRRTVLVEASPEGRRLAAEVLMEIQALESQWLRAFAGDEHDRLVADLEKLLAGLSPPSRAPTPGK